jgi:hypothetical protein
VASLVSGSELAERLDIDPAVLRVDEPLELERHAGSVRATDMDPGLGAVAPGPGMAAGLAVIRYGATVSQFS